ncbi:unnamed protein product, partial [Choristocarpus tenellus]
GVLWSVAISLTWGFWSREPEDLLAKCNLDVFIAWGTLTLHIGTFYLRIYRLWKLLVKHESNMWPTE